MCVVYTEILLLSFSHFCTYTCYWIFKLITGLQDDEGFIPDDFPIEGFTTPLDEKDSSIDEYIKFKNTLLGIYYYQNVCYD